MKHAAHIQTYALSPLLPSDWELVLNTAEHLLTVLVAGEITMQQRLTWQETQLILALVEALPGSCSNAALYVALTQLDLPSAEELLCTVEEHAMRELVMAPVLMVLRSCAAILAACDLGLQSVEGGYRLFRCRLHPW